MQHEHLKGKFTVFGCDCSIAARELVRQAQRNGQAQLQDLYTAQKFQYHRYGKAESALYHFGTTVQRTVMPEIQIPDTMSLRRVARVYASVKSVCTPQHLHNFIWSGLLIYY